MRRWLWGLGFIGLIILGLALFLRADAPFDFIGSQPPINVAWSRAYRQSLVRTERSITVYSFQAKYDRLVRTADKELRRKGYEVFHVDPREVTYSMGPSPYVHPGAKLEVDWGWVTLIKDTRRTSSPDPYKPLIKGKDIGWVTVSVHRYRPKSLIERCREWLGL